MKVYKIQLEGSTPDPNKGKIFTDREKAQKKANTVSKMSGRKYVVVSLDWTPPPPPPPHVQVPVTGPQAVKRTKTRGNKFFVAYPLNDAVRALVDQYKIKEEIITQFGQACYNKGWDEGCEKVELKYNPPKKKRKGPPPVKKEFQKKRKRRK